MSIACILPCNWLWILNLGCTNSSWFGRCITVTKEKLLFYSQNLSQNYLFLNHSSNIYIFLRLVSKGRINKRISCTIKYRGFHTFSVSTIILRKAFSVQRTEVARHILNNQNISNIILRKSMLHFKKLIAYHYQITCKAGNNCMGYILVLKNYQIL
jgi:hypothetical protein